MPQSLRLLGRRGRKRPFWQRHRFLLTELILAMLSLALWVASTRSPAFALGLSQSLGAWIRTGLGWLTGWIPFCLAELLLFGLVLFLLAWLIALIVGLVRAIRKRPKSPGLRRFLLSPLCLTLALLILFACAFGPCYHCPSLASQMNLEQEVNPDKLFFALDVLIDTVNAQVPQLSFVKAQAQNPLGFEGVARELNAQYDRFCANHSFLQPTGFVAKPVLLSHYMTYTHISGVYAFFTGESAINTNYPPYLLPYTVAHEYAHQRGVAPENEANFLAFVLCMQSEIPFLRYSGAANVFGAVANAAYDTDPQRYLSAIARLDPALSGEYRAYKEFFKPYENSPAADLSQAANDAYLKGNGQAQGTLSYSLITSLVTNYLWQQAQ